MYKIKLEQFEGPLDLLLFFIKRDELDIYDIPISYITKNFIEYINLMEELNLEIAGDFILMAATLMQIKVKMLLPREKNPKGEEIDPREELVQKLLEYKRYKEMSEEFSILESEQRKVFYRGYFEEDEKQKMDDLGTLLKNITLFDLARAFKKAIDSKPIAPIHTIEKINITIEEQMNFVLNKIGSNRSISFLVLVEEITHRIIVVVTFIAVLEMVKLGKIDLHESENFNDFEIFKLNG